MIPDTGSHLILCTSYGERSAHACSLENARTLLARHLDTLDAQVTECARVLAAGAQTPTLLVSNELVARALQDVSQRLEGESSPTLRQLLHGRAPKEGADSRPDVAVTAQMKDELALWAFKAGLTSGQLTESNAQTLADARPLGLAFLAPVVARAGERTVRLVPSYVLEAAAELKQLQTGAWKPTAQEHRVVSRYLQFINDWLVDTSDVRYDVIDFEVSAA